MVANDRQSAQLASTLAWLEDNLRENKAQVARLTQLVEQSQSQVWDLTHRVMKAEENSAALGTRLNDVPRLEVELDAFNERTTRSEERQASVETRVVDIVRQQQLDTDHLRTETNELVKRVDGWERLTQGWTGRLDTLEEVSRRTQEATSIVRQRLEDFERFVELVDQRAARTADALKRVDNEFSRLATDIEALHKQDALHNERQQVYVEIVKRLDEQLTDVAEKVNIKREIDEKLDLHRAGIRRSEERLGVLEETDEQLRQHVEDVQRAVTLIESKDKNLRDRLAGLQEQLGEYQIHVAEQFQKAQVLLERQKKRLIEDIERDIREIKVNAYRPVEE